MPADFRIAVIGSTGRGNYGHGLDTAWQAVPETEVVAVADDNAEGLAATAKKLGVTHAFADYREMLDTVRPDIVAVAPRWIDQHHSMVMAALERGMHVYMEKPFVRTLAEADEIVTACATGKLKLAVAHPTRYSPLMGTIRRLIADGELGQVLEYRARGKEDRRGGGEDLWVLGTHLLDMVHAIGGCPLWCSAQVRWQGHPVTAGDVFDGPEGIGPLAGDDVVATFGMPDGSTAYFSSRRNAGGQPSRYALQIHGSKGILELLEATLPPVRFLPDSSWSPGRTGKAWLPVSSAGIDQPEPLQAPEYRARHTLAIRDLLNCIREDREPIGNARAARDVTEMIVSVFESHRQAGRPVPLPLESRENPLTRL